MIRGDCSRLSIPFKAFPKSGDGIAPNFRQFTIEDFGQTLRFGDYEASTDSILYEYDPVYRKRARSKAKKLDKSFGGCLRRARLQKRLRQSDFEGIDVKEIGRIERGEVKQPQQNTIVCIEKALELSKEEILAF